MKMLFNKKFILGSFLILIFLSLAVVSASADSDDASLNQTYTVEVVSLSETLESENESSQINSRIESEDVTTYYQENSEFVSYIKDADNQPISGKKLSVLINNKVYSKISDNSGKVVLKLNLNPGTYKAKIHFDGDENYTESTADAVVKIKKATLSLTAGNLKTYYKSGYYFKAKVVNMITKNPVKNIKVSFKVYSSKNKYKIYWATTDINGIAKLKKNFKVGNYKVVTSIKKNKYLKAQKTKSTLTVKPSEGDGCCSYYLQISNTESIAGFRRDATNSKSLHIVKYKLKGISAVKQFVKNSYFFHTISASNGWMAGTGGMDNPSINHAIENLAGKMFKSGQIKNSYLKKIQRYEQRLGLGHFSIKSPDGKYAVVWGSGIHHGKLKAGEYFSSPNGRGCFRHGTWTSFNKNPAKAAIKIAATDSFGVNRRDATAFHWGATTHEGKTTSCVKVYAANDNGHLVGRSTGSLRDNIYFKGKFISKNSLPKTPSSKYLGKYDLGSIDKLIKIQTTVKAPKLTTYHNESKVFKVTVKNKQSGKAIKSLVLKVKVAGKIYSVKSNKNGIAQLKTNLLSVGCHNVVLYTNNIKYYVQSKSKIEIKK